MIYAVIQNSSTEFSLTFVLHSSTRKSNRLSNVIVTNKETNNQQSSKLEEKLSNINKAQLTIIKAWRKKIELLQWAPSLKKNYLLRTAVIAFLSLFMLHSNNEYAYTQEIKAKASDVPAVLSPTVTDCMVQWERAVGLLIWELSFLTLHLAARPE